jgi:hypothetical protein
MSCIMLQPFSPVFLPEYARSHTQSSARRKREFPLEVTRIADEWQLLVQLSPCAWQFVLKACCKEVWCWFLTQPSNRYEEKAYEEKADELCELGRSIECSAVSRAPCTCSWCFGALTNQRYDRTSTLEMTETCAQCGDREGYYNLTDANCERSY